MKTKQEERKVTSFRVKIKCEDSSWEDDKEFSLSDSGLLLWSGYYVETLMEDLTMWLNGSNLCVDGGSNTWFVNMKEWVEYVLANRYDIEKELRGDEQ